MKLKTFIVLSFAFAALSLVIAAVSEYLGLPRTQEVAETALYGTAVICGSIVAFFFWIFE